MPSQRNFLKNNLFENVIRKSTNTETVVHRWVKVFKNGPSKNLWKTAFKKFKVMRSAYAGHTLSGKSN